MSELLLARSRSAAIHIAYLDAYPEGFEFDVEAATVLAKHDLRGEWHEFGSDVFGRHWPMAGETRDEIPPQLLRIGVRFADGREAMNITGHDRSSDGPVMWPLRGGGGGGRFHQGYWVSPLPPPGPVALLCEWPAAGIRSARHEVDAQLILDGAERARALFPEAPTRVRDGREWRIGTHADVAWIHDGTSPSTAVTTAIPPIFPSYCMLVLPKAGEPELARYEQALVELLGQHSSEQPWWLGYLDTGASDVVFPYAPRTRLYYGHGYVLVQAGPQQAASWRATGSNRALPDLMFPADRSWLLSTMWDDDWTSIGGSEELVSSVLGHPDLARRARRVTLEQDARPPGHQA